MTRTSAGGAKPQNIVITGASSGIGAALASRYSRDAALLGLIGRNKARLEEVAERCRASGCEARTSIIDVRDRPKLAAWLEDFDRASPVDIVIANAGVQIGTAPDGKLEDSDAAYELMETNVLGVLNSIQPLIPRMLDRGRGRIVMMSSIAALFPLFDSSAYSASKAAVLTYSLALRGHLYDAGVRVTVICPGYVTSPMSARSTAWKPLEVSAEAAADRIVKALQKDKAVVTFPWLLAFAARLGAALPDALRRPILRPFRFHVSR
jgi:short-subunit dehydrogenase